MKELIDELRKSLDKYHSENGAYIETIYVNAKMMDIPEGRKIIVGYDLELVVKSL